MVTGGPDAGGVVVTGGTPGVMIPGPEAEPGALPTSSATAHMDKQQNRVRIKIFVFILLALVIEIIIRSRIDIVRPI